MSCPSFLVLQLPFNSHSFGGGGPLGVEVKVYIRVLHMCWWLSEFTNYTILNSPVRILKFLIMLATCRVVLQWLKLGHTKWLFFISTTPGTALRFTIVTSSFFQLLSLHHHHHVAGESCQHLVWGGLPLHHLVVGVDWLPPCPRSCWGATSWSTWSGRTFCWSLQAGRMQTGTLKQLNDTKVSWTTK